MIVAKAYASADADRNWAKYQLRPQAILLLRFNRFLLPYFREWITALAQQQPGTIRAVLRGVVDITSG